MTASQERPQRAADPGGVSIVSFSAWPGGVVVTDTALNDDVCHRFEAYELDYLKVLAQFRRVDELDAPRPRTTATRPCRKPRPAAARTTT